MEATDGILALFPFVCGICDAKFNGIANYYSHVHEHSEINEYLHCCFDTSSKPVKAENVYSCGKCQLVFPSLCTLYKHLLEDEIITEFVFKSGDKTAYELNEGDDHPIVKNLIAEEDEYENETNDRVEVKTELCYDSDTDSYNSFKGFSLETQKPSQADATDDSLSKKRRIRSCNKNKSELFYDSDSDSKNFTEISEKTQQSRDANTVDNSLSKKRKNISYNESSTNFIDDGCLDVCDNEQDMDGSADNFTEYFQEESTKNTKSKIRKKLDNNLLYPCEVCGGFYKRHALRGHKAVHAKRTFQCDQCELKFSSKSRLNQHTRIVHATESKFTCEECGMCFKALPYLQQHGKKHWQQRTIECQICHKMYKDKRALRRHLKQTHSDERPYPCSICDKSFKRQSYVQEHEETVHAIVGTFPCIECNKMFKSRKAVNKHLHIHKPPKHFCEVCGKSFVYHSNMMIHMKIHSKGV